jgi:hypothetical protein
MEQKVFEILLNDLYDIINKICMYSDSMKEEGCISFDKGYTINMIRFISNNTGHNGELNRECFSYIKNVIENREYK